MKRVLLIIIVLTLFFELAAQHRNPTYIWYYAGGRMGSELPMYELDWFGESGHKIVPRMNYMVGGLFGYCISYWTEFRVGMEYSDKSFAIDFNYPTVPPEDYNKIADLVEWQVGYIGFPMYFNLNLIHGMKAKWYVSTGITPEFRTNIKEFTTYMDSRREHTYNLQTSGDFNQVVFSGMFSMGLRIRFAQVMTIDIEPWYRQYLRSVHPTFITKYPFAVGGTIGIAYEW